MNVAMHGNKSQRQREQALTRFESAAVDTLVATDLAARGIDGEMISHVINLRPASGQRDLRAPHRPHRARRASRHRNRAPVTRPAPSVTKLAVQLGIEHGLHSNTLRRPPS